MFIPREFGDKMALSASPTSRSESGTSDSDGLVSKSRGTKLPILGSRQMRKGDQRSRML